MGHTPSRRGRAFVATLAAAVFALANYGCQPQPATAPNANGTAATASPSPGGSPSTVPPWPQGFPQGFPAAAVSGNVPLAINVPQSVTTPEQARPYFDYFSWESFIALNWPAASGTPGTPDQPNSADAFLKAPAGAPVVWGTYKDSFSLFGSKGDQRPPAWDAPANSPCPNAQTTQKTLYFVTKGDTPLMQTAQAFSAPLVDQRGNYVYYDVRYDQAQYNFIRGDDGDQSSWLYLLKNLAPKENAPKGVQMPMSTTSPAPSLGSIMVKAAWRLKTDKDDASRFYTVNAQVYNPQTKTCAETPVLLVGLHIAHKVSPFTAWVWSTFEQVDNVPADPDITPRPSPPPAGYSFNNGTDTPATTGGFNYKPALQPVPSPSPVQVTRVNPIPATPQGASTRDVNAYFQQLLKGTVWQYYQLVITQWPSNPGLDNFTLMENGGVYPQGSGAAFPQNGAVNTTQETYFQTMNDATGAGGNSCMSCHYRAGQSDFSWGLNRRAR